MPADSMPANPQEDPVRAAPRAGGRRRTICWDLPAETSIARKARELTRTTLIGWSYPNLIGDVVLMVDELVANAVTHGRAPIRLCLRVEPRAAPGLAVLICEVTDGDPHLPQLSELDHFGDGGRGLWIVRHLADDCGAWATPQGKVVWFALAMAAEAAPSGDGPGR